MAVGTGSGRRLGRRRVAGAGLAAALISAVVVMATGTAASATVTSVSGRAFGYYTQAGFFGGPQSLRGFGQVVCTGPDTPPLCVPDPQTSGGPTAAEAASPSVVLPPGGSPTLTQTDPDGAVGVFGPARIFENHGTITVSTQGTTGASGSVTSSAQVNDIQPQDPFQAPAPGGVSSTCTATETGLTGSTTITNGRLVLEDPNPDINGEPGEVVVTPPVNPAPGTEYAGLIANVNDFFTIVFNEQIRTPGAITVNAAHVYMEGPTAVGDMVIAQSHCGVVGTTANQNPVANDDAYATGVGQALTIPAAGVLANDTDPEAGALVAGKVPRTPPPTTGTLCPVYPNRCPVWGSPSQPANGSLALNANGSFTYTPNPGFAGIDSFTYMAIDPRGKSDTAVVNINVTTTAFLSVDDISVTEGNAGTTMANFTITRTGNTLGSSTVSYNTLNGTAVAPGDYTAKPVTPVTFAAGQTTKTVSVSVIGDTAVEAAETFFLKLTAPSAGTTITDNTGRATITNDDVSSFAVNDVSVAEGNAGTSLATFTVTRSSGVGTASVFWSTLNGTATAGSDYGAVGPTPLSFAAGETSKQVSVTVNGDTVVEPAETFFLKLTAPSAGTTIADGTGRATITNDDLITFVINDVTMVEGNAGTTLATFTVTRSSGLGNAYVWWNTLNGTAVSGSDYVAVPNTPLIFDAGQTAKTVSVTVNGDTVVEPAENFFVKLLAPSGGHAIADNTGRATLTNDDTTPAP